MSGSRLPARSRRLSHDELFASLSAAARARFAGPPRGLWDPEREDAAVDLGRGVLDAFALALHVLWTYQEAWGEEGFLATAQLDESVDRLLAGVGYRRNPGAAAVGLQHFRCRAGMRAILPKGFKVRSPQRGDEPEATFETLDVLRLDPELNEVRALWPADGAKTAPAGAGDLDVTPPTTGGPFDTPSLSDSLVDALQGARAGGPALRAAARARQKALRYRDMLGIVQEAAEGANVDTGALRAALDPICKALCEAQRDAAKAAPAAAADPLTESQEILARQLRQLERRVPSAVADLEKAIGKGSDESDTSYAARLAAMVRFLDAFVAGIVQDARDQVVILHGIDALSRLDEAFGGGDSPLGRAKKGQDRLYLFTPGSAPGQLRALSSVRPGDWFVIGEDVDRVDPRGQVTTERVYRQPIRVLRVGEARPSPSQPPLTLIQFEPALAKDFDLGRVVLLGNVAPISEGSTVEEIPVSSADRLTIPLARGPLTWLRDPSAPSGRRPEVELFVAKRPWRRVETLLDPRAGDACFAVEPTPGGGVVLRVGDGVEGVAMPDLPLFVRYRVGLGSRGNRAALRIDAPGSAHPAVEKTWNPLATAGGADPETRARARSRGPRVLAATDRAVSITDVQALALADASVLRARAFLQGTARRAVCVVVVAGPRGAPLVDDDLDALRRHLAARVPPGVRVVVDNRLFVPLRARIRLRTARGVDPTTIFRDVRLRLGVDRDEGAPPGLLDPDRVDLDDDLRLSSLYGALAGTPGVVSLVVSALHRDGEPVALHDRVEVGPRELLGWAKPADGSEGVELSYEEVRSP
jgi:hypothetical protein